MENIDKSEMNALRLVFRAVRIEELPDVLKVLRDELAKRYDSLSDIEKIDLLNRCINELNKPNEKR